VSGPTLRIATRASNLALWQADFVAEQLRSQDAELTVELVHVVTTGDRAAAPLETMGGVGVFTREIQLALLDQRADIAVHSLKDLPTEPVAGIALAAVPERASPWDALVLPTGSAPISSIRDLPRGARIGSGSQRRRSQLLHSRPDLGFLDVRGNVETRLRKLDEGAYDALILAEAGLDRLGLSMRIACRLAPPDVFPAVGQGALGIECREEDSNVRSIVERLSHGPTLAAVTAERRVLAQLHAGCHAPVGVSTAIDGNRLTLEAVVLSRDGRQRLHARETGLVADPVALGTHVADELLRQGAGPLIEAAAH
jgi:hydroxymethylbilane synthase